MCAGRDSELEVTARCVRELFKADVNSMKYRSTTYSWSCQQPAYYLHLQPCYYYTTPRYEPRVLILTISPQVALKKTSKVEIKHFCFGRATHLIAHF